MHRPTQQPRYNKIVDLLELIDEPNRSICKRIFAENIDIMRQAPGSRQNHHAWPGGYCDHVREAMLLGRQLYCMYIDMRIPLCSMSDVLLVLFLHDLEKPWRYRYVDGVLQINADLDEKSARRAFREKMFEQYGLVLSDEHKNALEFTEGEGDAYSPHERAVEALAVICHQADFASARLYHDCPVANGKDEWKGATRNKDFT